MRVNGLALCAGVGGMELGLHLAIGDTYRTVGYVEREAYAAATLVARMEDEALDRAPIWDDLATFDGRAMRGSVDLVSAGLPCQPYSVAGTQKGHADERALWPEFVRIVRECEPSLVFIENVPGFRKHFEPVWRELRRLGFEWAPPLLSTASESGAPHIRERFFALASHPDRLPPGNPRNESTDAHGARLEGRSLRGHGCSDECAPRSMGNAPPDPDPDRGRCESEWSGWIFDCERASLRHDADRCGFGCRICGTSWATESPPVRVDDGSPDRVCELRAIGNVGTPPVVYARAFLTLAELLT